MRGYAGKAPLGSRKLGGAILSTWNYRVILKNRRYAIHEVYYDELGQIWTCTEEPVYPEGETLEELSTDLEHYRLALEEPVLDYGDLVPASEPEDHDVPF